MSGNNEKGSLVITPKEYGSKLYLVLEELDRGIHECVYLAMNVNPHSHDFGKIVEWDVRDDTEGYECINNSKRIIQYTEGFRDIFSDKNSARNEIKDMLFDNLVGEGEYVPAVDRTPSGDVAYDPDPREFIRDTYYREFMKTIG